MKAFLDVGTDLKIRGVCSDTLMNETSNFARAIIEEGYNDRSNIITLSHPELVEPPTKMLKRNHAAGRKAYIPKKWRMSGDSDSARSQMSAASPQLPTLSPESITKEDGIRTPETDGTRKSGDENELHEDQPVDLSSIGGSSKQGYSILSEYLIFGGICS